MAQNKIQLFAPNAGTDSSDASGTYILDTNWTNNSDRNRGVVSGVASSSTFNTALRQTSFMSRVLAEGIRRRFTSLPFDISAEGTESELNSRISTLGNNFSRQNFIQPSEIVSSMIAKGQIKSDHLDTGSVTPNKLSALLPNWSSSATANNITATLVQDTKTGFKLNLSCNSVAKADTVKLSNNQSQTGMYVCGKLSGSTYDTFESIYYDQRIEVNPSGDLICSASVEANSFNATSDVRLKDNVVSSDIRASEIVDAIDIVDFNFKETPDVKQFGVIAQALQAVCPQAVVEGEDGYLRVKESKLVYILWKALQDANARIARLESIIKEK